MDARTLGNILFEEIDAAGSTAFVDRLRCDARDALLAGKGTIGTLTASSVNGKNFTKTADMNPAEVLQACQIAIDLYSADPKTVASSYADFRGVRR